MDEARARDARLQQELQGSEERDRKREEELRGSERRQAKGVVASLDIVTLWVSACVSPLSLSLSSAAAVHVVMNVFPNQHSPSSRLSLPLTSSHCLGSLSLLIVVAVVVVVSAISFLSFLLFS